jgi:hypothetical protein
MNHSPFFIEIVAIDLFAGRTVSVSDHYITCSEAEVEMNYVVDSAAENKSGNDAGSKDIVPD